MVPIKSNYLYPLSKICFFLIVAAATPKNSHADDSAPDTWANAALESAIYGNHRDEKNTLRDQFRRPKETLAFFGFRPDMTVVEFSPGGGWYTEILAPALRERGKLYAAHYDINHTGYERRSLSGFLAKLVQSPDVYDRVMVTTISQPGGEPMAPLASADMVLTFRNVHNWLEPEAGGEANGIATFAEMARVLKPGGILGVVEHRWPDPETEDPTAANGYVSEERVIAMAAAAGFEFVASSDHNRNAKDTHDHPDGVWTLLPELYSEGPDKEKYRPIGESDRMTLKFRKPAN